MRFGTFKLIKVLFICFASSQFSQNAFAESLTDRWIKEAMVSQDGQKFFELGHCYGFSIDALETKNEVLVNRVDKMTKVVDLDKMRNAIMRKDTQNKSSIYGAYSVIIFGVQQSV